MDFGESAVTPVIGTILVLGISVMGIAATLFFGVPVIKRMQDEAALEATLGQFQQVRAEELRLGSPGASLDAALEAHGGTLGMRSGTRMMVTTYMDSSLIFGQCELRILGWEDGNDELTWTLPAGGTCRAPSVDDGSDSVLISGPDCFTGDSGATITIPGVGVVSLPALACFEAYRADRSTHLVSVAPAYNLVAAAAPPCTNIPTVLYQCPAGVKLKENILATDDWMFRLTDGAATPTVYLEAWLLHQDRLEWSRGSTRAAMESGTVFGSSGGQWFLQGKPAFKDDASATSRAFLHLPMWQAATSFATNDPGSHGFTSTFVTGETRTSTATATAQKVRLDFQGDLAEAWCNTFLQRSATNYRQETADVMRNCAPVLPSADRIRGLFYDPGGLLGPRFPFALVQQVMDARFEV